MSQNKVAKGVYVAVLNQGNVRAELSFVLTELTHQHKYRIFLAYPAAKPIANNRNQIIQDFLKRKEYDYLMMVDSDIVPPTNILDLIDFQKDVLGALCFAYLQNAIYPLAMERLPEEEIEKDPERRPFKVKEFNGDEGLVEVDAIGSGCIVMSRKVLEALEDEQPFCNIYDEKGLKRMGLDFSFCQKAREKGFQVFTHLDYICSHWVTLDLKTLYSALRDKQEIKRVQIKPEPSVVTKEHYAKN